MALPGQMSLVVDGYNHDPRELVDIPEVRHFLKRLAAQWPYWGFFLNQAFAGMNALFDQYGFPEHELEAMSMGLVALIAASD